MLGKIAIAVVLLVVFVGIIWYFLMRTEKFENPALMSYYFLPGCGWCKKFSPIWEAFEEKLGGEQLPLKTRKVDGSKEENAKELEEKGITGFPHVDLKVGDKTVVYEGERTVASLVEFAKKNL